MSVVRSGLLVSAALAAPTAFLPPPLKSGPETADPARVERRLISPLGLAGRLLYVENCAECHGADGKGTTQGPSLLHRSYSAAQFSQRAFHETITKGVTAQRWAFGDMPALDLSFNDIEKIARYVREVREPHKYAR